MKYDYEINASGRLVGLAWPPLTKQTLELDNEPEGHLTDYIVENGKLVHDPLPVEEVPLVATEAEKLEAQVTYTAMMTGTLLPDAEE